MLACAYLVRLYYCSLTPAVAMTAIMHTLQSLREAAPLRDSSSSSSNSSSELAFEVGVESLPRALQLLQDSGLEPCAAAVLSSAAPLGCSLITVSAERVQTWLAMHGDGHAA
jgi:hypothetical protein